MLTNGLHPLSEHKCVSEKLNLSLAAIQDAPIPAKQLPVLL